jgi:hypothetical protein
MPTTPKVDNSSVGGNGNVGPGGDGSGDLIDYEGSLVEKKTAAKNAIKNDNLLGQVNEYGLTDVDRNTLITEINKYYTEIDKATTA